MATALTDDELRRAWRLAWRPSWPTTYEACMADPVCRRLVEMRARHPQPGDHGVQVLPPVARPEPPSTPLTPWPQSRAPWPQSRTPWPQSRTHSFRGSHGLDRKRAAAGDFDD